MEGFNRPDGKYWSDRCAILQDFLRKHCIKMRNMATFRAVTFHSTPLAHRRFLKLALFSFNTCMWCQQVRGDRWRVATVSATTNVAQREAMDVVDEDEQQLGWTRAVVLMLLMLLMFSRSGYLPIHAAWVPSIVVAAVVDDAYRIFDLACSHIALDFALLSLFFSHLDGACYFFCFWLCINDTRSVPSGFSCESSSHMPHWSCWSGLCSICNPFTPFFTFTYFVPNVFCAVLFLHFWRFISSYCILLLDFVPGLCRCFVRWLFFLVLILFDVFRWGQQAILCSHLQSLDRSSYHGADVWRLLRRICFPTTHPVWRRPSSYNAIVKRLKYLVFAGARAFDLLVLFLRFRDNFSVSISPCFVPSPFEPRQIYNTAYSYIFWHSLFFLECWGVWHHCHLCCFDFMAFYYSGFAEFVSSHALEAGDSDVLQTIFMC